MAQKVDTLEDYTEVQCHTVVDREQGERLSTDPLYTALHVLHDPHYLKIPCFR